MRLIVQVGPVDPTRCYILDVKLGMNLKFLDFNLVNGKVYKIKTKRKEEKYLLLTMVIVK